MQGPSIANGDATVLFNRQRNSIYSVPWNLTPAQKAACSKYTGLELYGRSEVKTSSDHLEMAVARDIVRTDAKTSNRLEHGTVKTLFMGIAEWELSQFEHNEANSFYFHGGEAKDSARLALSLVEKVASRVKEFGFRREVKLNKTRRKRLLAMKAERLETWVDAFNVSGKMERIWCDRSKALAAGASRLCYFDSAYEVGLEGLCEDAVKSGALEAVVVGFFPNNFIDARVAESTLYDYEEIFEPQFEDLKRFSIEASITVAVHLGLSIKMAAAIGKFYVAYLALCGAQSVLVPGVLALTLATKLTGLSGGVLLKMVASVIEDVRDRCTRVAVTWKSGASNGYLHNKAVWKQLLTTRKYVSHRHNIQLDSEICTRAGEMYYIKVTFCQPGATGPSVSRLCLHQQFDFVQVFDFKANWDEGRKSFRHKDDWKYISLSRFDFESLYLWAMAEPEGTLTPELVINAAAKMREGLAINNNEYLPPWKLQAKDVPWMALAVMLESMRDHGKIAEIAKDESGVFKDYESNMSKFTTALARGVLFAATGGLIVPVVHLIKWLLEKHPTVEIVVYPNRPALRVEESVGAAAAMARGLAELRREAGKKSREYKPRMEAFVRSSETKIRENKCRVCHDLQGQIGDQLLECVEGLRRVKLQFGEDNVQRLSADLMEAKAMFRAGGNTKLATAVDQAKEALPIKGFEYEVDVEFFVGAAGVGKSFTFFELLDKLQTMEASVTVTAPFNKLGPEYENFTTMAGKTCQAIFKTQHYLLTLRNRRVLLVDEIGAYDTRLLAFACYLLQVQQVYIAGDPDQTLLQETEGLNFMAPGSMFPFETLAKHRLIKQHRSNPFFTAWMNENTSHNLIPSKARIVEPSRPPKFISLADFMALEGQPHMPKMVFSHESASMFGLEVRGEDKVTVRANQGQTLSVKGKQGVPVPAEMRGVALGIQPRDSVLFDVHGMLYVAMTRHKYDHQLYIVYEGLETDAHVQDFKTKARLHPADIEHYETIVKEQMWRTLDVEQAGGIAGTDVPLGDEVLSKFGGELCDQDGNTDLLAEKEFEVLEAEHWAKLQREHVKEKEKEFGIGLDSHAELELQLAAGVYDPDQTFHTCSRDALMESAESAVEAEELAGAWMIKAHYWLEGLSGEKKETYKVDGKYLVPLVVMEGVMRDANVQWITCQANGKLTGWTRSVKALNKKTAQQLMEDDGVRFFVVTDRHVEHVNTHLRLPPSMNDRVTVSVQYHDGVDVHKGRKFESIPVRPGFCIPYELFGQAPANVYATVDAVGLNVRDNNKFVRVKQVRFSSRIELSIAGKHAAIPTSFVQDLAAEDFSPHRHIKNKPARVGMDSHRTYSLLDSTEVMAMKTKQPFLNAGAIALGPQVAFKKGTFINVGGMRTSRTKKAKKAVIKVREKYKSATPGLALHYGRSGPEELIAGGRMLKKKRKIPWTWQGYQFARTMATTYFRRSFKRDVRPLPKALAAAVAHRFRQDARVRNYEGRALAEMAQFKHPHLATMQNKQQRKVPKFKSGTVMNFLKAGQGLSMSSAQMNIAHGEAVRVMNVLYYRNFKGFYDNYETQQEFRRKVTGAVRKLPISSTVAIGDAVEFDSGQNWFTVAMEMENRRLLTAKDPWLSQFYASRGRTKVICYGKFRGVIDGEKGSGYLDTLLGNSTSAGTMGKAQVVSAGTKGLTTGNAADVLRSITPAAKNTEVESQKGDDFMYMAPGIEMLPCVRDEISQHTIVDYGITLSRRGGEFTGEVVTREGMFKDIIRATRKAYCAPSPERNRGGYGHFVELQKSVRDHVKDINENSLGKTIAATAEATGTNAATVKAHYAALVALGHLSFEQWSRLVKTRTVPQFSLPGAKGPIVPL